MQQSTVFSILMILLTKRKVSRDYLAERFSVSKRTVSRYLNILEDAGVPIVSVSGVGGGISLADDYTVDKNFLSEAELARIRSALDKTADDFPDNVNRALSEKLEHLGKTRERDGYIIKQDELYIDCEYEQAAFLRPRLRTLSQAIEVKRAVEIKYIDSRGCVSYRTVEPYTLVFKSGAWYVYAMCRLRGDFRLFRLSRISDIRITSKSFMRYESRLTEKLELEYYNEIYIELEFEFFPAVRESVEDWLGGDAVSERGTTLLARAEVPLTDALYKHLLAYGSSIKVTEPPELAERLKEDARLMLEVYGGA